MLRRLFCTGLPTLLVICLVGCGESGPPQPSRTKVQGTVTLDGAPLEKGTISLTSEEDVRLGRPAGGSEIVNGKYEMLVTPGKKQVAIRAPKESGQPDDTGLVPTVESIPAKYNTKTELEAEVQETGPQTLDFSLTS